MTVSDFMDEEGNGLKVTRERVQLFEKDYEANNNNPILHHHQQQQQHNNNLKKVIRYKH